jgi:transcriptional regulator NrdR family protein
MPRGRPIKCPYCKSGHTVAKGHRKTLTLGLRPLRKCKNCGRRFTYVKKAQKAPSAPESPE